MCELLLPPWAHGRMVIWVRVPHWHRTHLQLRAGVMGVGDELQEDPDHPPVQQEPVQWAAGVFQV